MSDGPERLTPRVRRVLSIAEDEANALRQAEIGTEHLLLGLLREGRGLAARGLRELGVEPDQLAQRIRARLPLADVGSDQPIILGPAALDALEMARAEARRLHHDYVGTEHLLLGLLRHGEGPAFVALVGIGVTLERGRRTIVGLLNELATEETESSAGLPAGTLIVPSRRLFADRAPAAPEAGACRRCERPRHPDWRFCPFCGEACPTCERCKMPLPALAGVRFCPACGTMVEDDERK